MRNHLRFSLQFLFVVVLVTFFSQTALAGILDLGGLLPANYIHVGFNRVAAGVFSPIAGADADHQAGLIVPALEHDQEDGALFIPGISWNPLNLGYKGKTENLHSFLHGSLEMGPSIQAGEAAKSVLRWACQALPKWDSDNYGFLKSVLAPGGDTYADIGVYAAFPLNQFGDIGRMRPGIDLAGTLVQKFGKN